jgi:hypothetical protein
MKKVNHTRSLASMLVIFFVFTAIVSNALNAFPCNPVKHEAAIAKKTNGHSTSDTQLPYEEKEKEEENGPENENKSQHNRHLICLQGEILSLTIAVCQQYYFYHAPRAFWNATHIPLYLAKRALLI